MSDGSTIHEGHRSGNWGEALTHFEMWRLWFLFKLTLTDMGPRACVRACVCTSGATVPITVVRSGGQLFDVIDLNACSCVSAVYILT